MNIKKIIEESIQGYNVPKKKSCSCGCNTCHDKKKPLNESKEFVKHLVKETYKKIKQEKLNEETTSFLYKLEGILVTNTHERNQTDILSDIRSISGVTIVSSKEYNPDAITTDNSNYTSYLTVKIDPHPFIGRGGFGKETLKMIYSEIKKVIGVKAFRLKKKPERINESDIPTIFNSYDELNNFLATKGGYDEVDYRGDENLKLINTYAAKIKNLTPSKLNLLLMKLEDSGKIKDE